MKSTNWAVVTGLAITVVACGDGRPGFEFDVYQRVPSQYHVTAIRDSTTVTVMSDLYTRYHFVESFADYETAVAQGISLRAIADDGTEVPFILRPHVCRESCDPTTSDCGDSLVAERLQQGTSDFVTFNLSQWSCHYADGAEFYDGNNDSSD